MIEIFPIVKDKNGNILEKKKDYEDNLVGNLNEPGNKKYIITGKNDYIGTKEKTFVVYVNVQKLDISLDKEKYEFTGNPIEPKITCKLNGDVIYQFYDDGQYKAYEVIYSDNINSGQATILIEGTTMPSEQKINFIIQRQSMLKTSDDGIQPVKYDGNEHKMHPRNVMLGEFQLQEETDYSLSFPSDDYINAGEKKVEIEGIGNFKDKRIIAYTISQAAISDCEIKNIDEKYVYNDKEIKPEPIIELNGIQLQKTKDYDVKYHSDDGDDYIIWGNKSIEITGKGNFNGKKTESYSIVDPSLSYASIEGINENLYIRKNGDKIEIKPTVKVHDRILQKEKDYQQNIEFVDNEGKHSLVVTGKGIFKDSKKIDFTAILAYLAIKMKNDQIVYFKEEETSSQLSVISGYSTDEEAMQLIEPFKSKCGSKDNIVSFDDVNCSVSSIAPYTFASCYNLSSVSLSNSLKEIGDYAFNGCSSLQEVNLFNDKNYLLDRVGDYAFSNTKLKKAYLSLRSSSTDTWWGDYCFKGCKDLEEISIVNSTYTSRGMFSGCSRLSSVTFMNDAVNYVFPYVFENCKSLKDIVLPSQLWFISKGMFYGCNKLESVRFMQNEDDSTLINLVQNNAFYGCSRLRRIEFPKSLNSLKDFEPRCLSGSYLSAIEFKGISDSYLSTLVDRTGIGDIYLNTNYEFRDDFYGYVKSYEQLEKTIVETNTNFSSDVPYDEKQYNYFVECLENNANSISSIISLADEKNIPIVMYVAIDYSLYDALIENPGIETRQRLLLDTFGEGGEDKGVEAYRYKKCDFKIGTKQFSYDYVITDDEIEQYEQNTDKTAISAIFINYILNLGNITAKEDDPDKDPRPASANVANITSRISSKLTALKNITNLKANTPFNVISKFMLGSSSGTSDMLFSYGNYGMILMRWRSKSTTIKKARKTGIQYPSTISDYDKEAAAILEKAENDVQNYIDKHPEIEDYPYPQGLSRNEYAARKANSELIALAKSSSMNLSFVSCDCDYLHYPDAEDPEKYYKINDLIGIKSDVMQDWMLSSGLFGLHRNCIVISESGKEYQFNFDPLLFVEELPDKYESDKTTKDDFQVQTGKWYYNIKELKEYADKMHIPVYAIYSSAGCNPCLHYLNNIHMNAGFQEWAKKQKFLLGRLEAEYPKAKDKELQFCEDEFARDALNYTRKGHPQSTNPNAMGQTYADASSGETLLPPPCMIFYYKKEDGTVISHYDYSMHNIQSFLDTPSIGVEGTIQYIKSLCLYHFDNNSLDNPQFVVDAGKEFNKQDYHVDPKNPYRISDDAISLNRWTDISEHTVKAVTDQMVKVLKSVASDSSKYPTYIGGCLWDQFDWTLVTFDYFALEMCETGQQINSLLDTNFIQIGDKYYKLQVDPADYKRGIDTPCGRYTLYKYFFVEKPY